MNKSFPARPSALREVRSFIRERARETNFYPEVTEDLVLAVSEACANSVLHSRSSAIEVHWKRRADGAQVEVMDSGVFRGGEVGPFVESGLGYGIPMMRTLVDEVDIQHGTEARPGTRVTLVMRKRRIRRSSSGK